MTEYDFAVAIHYLMDHYVIYLKIKADKKSVAPNLQILLVHYVIYVKFKADKNSTNICGHEAQKSCANIPPL